MEVTNVWGIFVVPVGIVFCFGPALVLWLLSEDRVDQSEVPVPNLKAVEKSELTETAIN